jgi:hypothetical protein
VGTPLVRFCEGLDGNVGMDEIVWHRRETRRQAENTKRILQPGESPAYSNSPERGSVLTSLHGTLRSADLVLTRGRPMSWRK